LTGSIEIRAGANREEREAAKAAKQKLGVSDATNIG
jgi:hypothetical protein